VSVVRPDLPLLLRISSALIQQAGRTRLLVETGRFIAVIDKRTDALWASFAVPDPGQWKAGPLDAHAFLPGLGEIFAHSGRQLRFEFFEDMWPGLAEELERAGLARTGRQPVLTCAPRQLAASATPGITVRRLSASDSEGDLKVFLQIQAAAFTSGAGETGLALGHAEIGRLREELLAGAQRSSIGYLGQDAAGAGSALIAGDVCEIAGVGTLPERRGRGVAAAVSAALARDHFQRGGALAWLSAGSDAAEAVYRRVGFVRTGAFQVTCGPRPGPGPGN
jgi:ribosomal protein S18 acetylase RimI-like enzyme